MHWYWHDLAWDSYTSFFPNLYQSYGLWFTPKFCFRSIFWGPIDRITPNFIYAFILTRSSLGLLHSIFRGFVRDFLSAQYLENKLTEFHQISYMHWYWQDLPWDCYTSFFPHFYQSYDPWFMPELHFSSFSWEHIDWIQQILCMHSCWQDLGGNCFLLFFALIFESWPLFDVRILFLLNVFRFSCLISLELGIFTALRALQWGYSQILWQF